jgi:hypothetical protein
MRLFLLTHLFFIDAVVLIDLLSYWLPAVSVLYQYAVSVISICISCIMIFFSYIFARRYKIWILIFKLYINLARLVHWLWVID